MAKKSLVALASVALAVIVFSAVISVSFGVPVIGRGLRGGEYFHNRDGYYYHHNNFKSGKHNLKCIHYETGCRGRAQIDPTTLELAHTQRHNNHLRDDMFTYPATMRLRRRILRRCRTLEPVPFRRIVREERVRFPPQIRIQVSYTKIRDAMRRARLSRYPPPPPTLSALTNILQNPQYRTMTMTHDGEDSIYAGSVTAQDGSHNIIFASRRMLRFVRNQKIIHSDGTFKSRPAVPASCQVFTIVTTWNFRVLPVAWVLMERKTREAYEAVLRFFRLLIGPNFQIRRVITDYEIGQQSAWEHVFAGIVMQGCLWHLARRFTLKARTTYGLGAHLRNPFVRRIVRLCSAIPLLPMEHFARAFRAILVIARRGGMRLYRLVRPFLAYVSTHWVHNRHRQRWMSVCGCIHRTNNACESCNRLLSSTLGVRRPNIYAFLWALLNLEIDAYTDILAMEEGEAPQRRRRATAVATDHNLRNLMRWLPRNPAPRDLLRYLRRGAYALQNVFEDAGLGDFGD